MFGLCIAHGSRHYMRVALEGQFEYALDTGTTRGTRERMARGIHKVFGLCITYEGGRCWSMLCKAYGWAISPLHLIIEPHQPPSRESFDRHAPTMGGQLAHPFQTSFEEQSHKLVHSHINVLTI